MKSRDASVERENLDGCPGSFAEGVSSRSPFYAFHKEAVIAESPDFLPPPKPLVMVFFVRSRLPGFICRNYFAISDLSSESGGSKDNENGSLPFSERKRKKSHARDFAQFLKIVTALLITYKSDARPFGKIEWDFFTNRIRVFLEIFGASSSPSGAARFDCEAG